MGRFLLLVIAGLLAVVPATSSAESDRWTGWCLYKWKPNEPPPPRLNLPAWVCQLPRVQSLSTKYTPYVKINPFFLTGDFDGDGKTDIAIWVRNNKTKDIGVVIIHRGNGELFYLGAGVPTNDWGPDLSFFDMWSLQPKGPLTSSPYEDATPQLVGDALWFGKSESSSAFVYWNGTKYVWYQESD